MQIKERRKALKITQKELADLAGISINTVVAAERAKLDDNRALAQNLQTRIDDLKQMA